MVQRFRHPATKWSLRLLFALAACELTLALGSELVEHVQSSRHSSSDMDDGSIVCVGDSNTFGIGADEGHSYPAQLKELLHAAGDERRVVNVGVAGFTTRMALDALDRLLAESTPSCVLFLAGNNDRTQTPELLDLPRADPTAHRLDSINDLLSHLRTWRIGRTLWRTLRGDLQRAEFGGAALRDVPNPCAVPSVEWESAYRSSRSSGISSISSWLEFFWNVEEPKLMREAATDLIESPRFDEIQRILRQSIATYAWELEGIESGHWGPAPRPIERALESDAFLHVSTFLAEWSGARDPDVIARFEQQPLHEHDPWGNAYLRLHQGFAAMLRRDWEAAATRLAEATMQSESISPRVGWPYALGGTALARSLALGTTRSADGAVAANPLLTSDPGKWEMVYWSRDLPIGREWMAVAEIVDGARQGLDSPAHAAGRRRAHERFEAPCTAPLRWLFERPRATFEEIAANLALEPCRCGWWGIRRFFFRNAKDDEFARLAAVQHERLATLAREHGFEVVVLTYFAEDEPVFNETLRALATDRGWPLADVHADHSRSELEADDRKRYFSADLGHPNADGYALIAKKAFEVLQAEKARARSPQ